MLTSLEIRDLAVISHAVFTPCGNLNVISGETGAGKSLLIDSIGLIMGKKASRSLIRDGAGEAFVEAVFDISDCRDENIRNILSDAGIDTEDDTLIISRTISPDGRSVVRMNGRTVILALLRRVSSFLVDIHGQHDTQQIFDPERHIDLLDGFIGRELIPYKEDYLQKLNAYKSIVREIKSLSLSPELMAERRAYLTGAVEEIESLRIKDNELSELKERKKEMNRIRSYHNGLVSADEMLSAEDVNGNNVFSRMNDLISVLRSIKAPAELIDQAAGSLDVINGLSASISDAISSCSYDPSDEAAVDRRLDDLNAVADRYGDDIGKFLSEARSELDSMENASKRLSELKSVRADSEKELLKSAEELSSLRKKKAKELSDSIVSELSDLMIENAVFEVEFTKREKSKFFSSHGTDDVMFLFSANPGQSPKPLSQTASGGEASRIMLAVKTILSDADTVPTLIFDEIDTGVSGKAALSIAGKLRRIGRKHQVLCVTHTSALAAASDVNFLISKSFDGDNTTTMISKLDENGKIDEVSRLLSGSGKEESLKLSRKLIEDLTGD